MLFFRICTHSVFNLMVMTAILLNTIVLSLDRYPMPDE
jgi:hypothetical protein